MRPASYVHLQSTPMRWFWQGDHPPTRTDRFASQNFDFLGQSYYTTPTEERKSPRTIQGHEAGARTNTSLLIKTGDNMTRLDEAICKLNVLGDMLFGILEADETSEQEIMNRFAEAI